MPKMKWSDIALFALPSIAVFVPQLQPLVPSIMRGISEADKLGASATDQEKRDHLVNIVRAGAESATATGRIRIDPEAAAKSTLLVVGLVDSFKGMIHELRLEDAVRDLPAPVVS